MGGPLGFVSLYSAFPAANLCFKKSSQHNHGLIIPLPFFTDWIFLELQWLLKYSMVFPNSPLHTEALPVIMKCKLSQISLPFSPEERGTWTQEVLSMKPAGSSHLPKRCKSRKVSRNEAIILKIGIIYSKDKTNIVKGFFLLFHSSPQEKICPSIYLDAYCRLRPVAEAQHQTV